MAKTTRKNVVDSGYLFEHNPTEHLQPPRLEPHGFGSKNKIDTFKFQFVVVRDGRHLTVGPYAQTTSNLCAVRIERKPARIGPTTLGFSAIIAAAESVGHVIGPSCWGGGGTVSRGRRYEVSGRRERNKARTGPCRTSCAARPSSADRANRA